MEIKRENVEVVRTITEIEPRIVIQLTENEADILLGIVAHIGPKSNTRDTVFGIYDKIRELRGHKDSSYKLESPVSLIKIS